MKLSLSPQVVKILRLDTKPVSVDPKGRPVFEPNSGLKEYIVFDSDRNSPIGFGVRVAKKKTYIIQRRVPGTKKVIKATLGDCADLTLDEAREKAAEYGKTIKGRGRNPNEIAAEISAAEITVGGAMTSYKAHLKNRKSKPAKENTIRNYERAERRFVEIGWWETKTNDLSSQDIIDAFLLKAETAPTANEQNFTWLMTAMRHAVDLEQHDAAAQGRSATLSVNPFAILKIKDLYRDPAEVEEQRAKNRSINPLGPSTTLGPFIEAAWARRSINDNATGVDFIITELSCGTRKGETGRLKWGEMLSQTQRDNGESSHVWLEEGEYGPHVFICRDDTKNRRAHRIPIGPFLTNLLRRRRDETAEKTLCEGFGRRGREWVFPARNRTAALSGGHYKDAGTLMDNIAAEIALDGLNPHDLRRSFGSVMTALQVPGTIQSVLLNHTVSKPKTDADVSAAVTARYNRPEWALLREWAERIQEYIFLQAPNLYNSVRPAERPAVPAPPPHIPTPPKPRTGRPRKASSGGKSDAA